MREHMNFGVSVSHMPVVHAGKSLNSEQNERARRLLERLLNELGYTQEDLAKEFGVHQSTISSFRIRRQGTSFNIAWRIAELAGEDPADALGLPSSQSRLPDELRKILAANHGKWSAEAAAAVAVRIRRTQAAWGDEDIVSALDAVESVLGLAWRAAQTTPESHLLPAHKPAPILPPKKSGKISKGTGKTSRTG